MKSDKKRLITRRPRLYKKTLLLPEGIVQHISNDAQKLQLTPEEWIISACFEKLRRGLPQIPRASAQSQNNQSGDVPNFFLSALRNRNK